MKYKTLTYLRKKITHFFRFFCDGPPALQPAEKVWVTNTSKRTFICTVKTKVQCHELSLGMLVSRQTKFERKITGSTLQGVPMFWDPILVHHPVK